MSGKRVLLALALVLTGVSVLAGGSYAVQGAPSSLEWPALEVLPPADISTEQQASVASLLGGELATSIGINQDSLTSARSLANTSVGKALVLTGTRGVCVVLLPAASCQQNGDGGGKVAVYVSDDAGNLVGGGILNAETNSASIERPDGGVLIPRLVPGGFVVEASDELSGLWVGGGAAIAAPRLSSTTIPLLGYHCTRYAPVISQDSNCNVSGTMYSSGYYSTPSVALRDSNVISLSASRQWHLWYSGGNGSSVYGNGTYGVMSGSNGYAYARCEIDGSSVSGHCVTDWHD